MKIVKTFKIDFWTYMIGDWRDFTTLYCPLSFQFGDVWITTDYHYHFTLFGRMFAFNVKIKEIEL